MNFSARLWALFGLQAVLYASSSAIGRDLDYYLPKGTSYSSSITTPSDFLGYQVGDWHLRHDQLVGYLRRLSEESPRIHFEEIGRTYEQRPLVMVTVTSEANHGRLGEIQEQHLKLSDPESVVEPDEKTPVVMYMGYSVHGDESSGANAVPIIAYYLAAGQGSVVDELLESTVILIDPCLNPDGFSRFAQWANSHRGQQAVGNTEHREHHAVWPGGRTNHYWFDLNRDWLLAQHPESQARLRKFHAWRPNVHTDFHEMGAHSTYFFQPGVPERKHPATPAENVTLTHAFAGEHAAALDKIRSLYFTEERFDDFYYGKGSTYPDIHGGVGILFEQASARGHRRESPHGEFDFPFTIRNQVRTSLSTFTAGLANRERLLRYQQEFFSGALALAQDDPVKGYIFGEQRDRNRLRALLELLQRHEIKVYQLGEAAAVEGVAFAPESSYVVPLAQPQYRLIKALFERRTQFEDDIFYDVSTWTMPLAFGLAYGEWRQPLNEGLLGEALNLDDEATSVIVPGNAYAYVLEWHDYLAPKVLAQLQREGVRVSVAGVPLRLATTDGVRDFARGTLVIPMARQRKSASEISGTLRRACRAPGLKVHAIVSGLTADGVDLGSGQIKPLKPIRPALVVGSGVSHYEAGEVWHLLDHRMGLTLPLLELATLGKLDLERYSHLILVDGSYGAIGAEQIEELKRWVRRGGILWAQKRAARWAAEKGLVAVKFVKKESSVNKDEHTHDHHQAHETADGAASKGPAKAVPKALAYGDYHAIEDAKRTSGAIFRALLDLTHPLSYGYRQAAIPVFRNSNLVMQPSQNPYATPLRYAEDPLMSGYVFPENLERFRGSGGLIAEKVGKGAVIVAVDNPNFRAFWYGTNRLFLNALFFGQILEGTNPKPHDDASAAQDHHH